MDWPKFAKRLLLADGHITELEADLIKRAVLEDGVVDREELDFLAELKREAVSVHPKFDAFFLGLVKRVILADGSISDAEACWLRKLLFADHQLSQAEIRLVEELRAEASVFGPEFEELCKECLTLRRGDFQG